MEPRRILSYLFLVYACCILGCQSESEVEKAVPNRDIKAVMEAHVDALMSIPGVTAVAIGATDDGTPCIRVLLVEKSEAATRKIPASLEGYPVVVEVSGEIKPLTND